MGINARLDPRLKLRVGFHVAAQDGVDEALVWDAVGAEPRNNIGIEANADRPFYRPVKAPALGTIEIPYLRHFGSINLFVWPVSFTDFGKHLWGQLDSFRTRAM